MLTIYTGAACSCKRGIERDNCAQCEGSGKQIDFRAMRETKTVSFDRETLKRFKRAHAKCEAEQFEFQGAVYLKAYAKYLIQYLDGRFANVQ